MPSSASWGDRSGRSIITIAVAYATGSPLMSHTRLSQHSTWITATSGAHARQRASAVAESLDLDDLVPGLR